jgi:hypothetical protein
MLEPRVQVAGDVTFRFESHGSEGTLLAEDRTGDQRTAELRVAPNAVGAPDSWHAESWRTEDAELWEVG